MKKRIVLNGLEAVVSIGIHDFELAKPQPYRLDICLVLTPSYRAHRDQIDETVNYDALRSAVLGLLGSGHFNLQETVAQRVMDLCFELDPRVIEARVCTAKTSVYPDCASVGLDYALTREEWTAELEASLDAIEAR